MRTKLSNVELAKDKATELAEGQKHLARDVMDKYEEKLVDLSGKYDVLKQETKKHREDAKRYREQREQRKYCTLGLRSSSAYKKV